MPEVRWEEEALVQFEKTFYTEPPEVPMKLLHFASFSFLYPFFGKAVSSSLLDTGWGGDRRQAGPTSSRSEAQSGAGSRQGGAAGSASRARRRSRGGGTAEI